MTSAELHSNTRARCPDSQSYIGSKASLQRVPLHTQGRPSLLSNAVKPGLGCGVSLSHKGTNDKVKFSGLSSITCYTLPKKPNANRIKHVSTSN